jgi:hypothetical protein
LPESIFKAEALSRKFCNHASWCYDWEDSQDEEC